MKNSNKGLRLLAVMLLVSLVLSAVMTAPVKAQSTVLSISPVTSVAYTCDYHIVTVRVDDVTALYGYDIIIDWTSDTANAIEVVDVTNGGFLDMGFAYPATITNAASSGTVRYIMTQLTPSVAKSGAGDLISIRFRTLLPGATINFTVSSASILSEEDGDPIPFVTPTQIGTVTTSAECPYTTSLEFYPLPDQVCFSGRSIDYTLYVRVRAAVNLYSYSLQISFTPGFDIEVINVTNGGFLSPVLPEPGNFWNNTTGLISFGAFQLGTEPKTGVGDLIKIDMRFYEPDQIVNFSIDGTTSRLVNSDLEDIEFTTSTGSLYVSSCSPTSVDLLDFTATGGVRAVTLNWKTTNEVDNLGFNLYRASSENGKKTKINEELIPKIRQSSNLTGATYEYVDTDFSGKPASEGGGTTLRQAVNGGRPYYYWLESVSLDGETELMGPVVARVKNK